MAVPPAIECPIMALIATHGQSGGMTAKHLLDHVSLFFVQHDRRMGVASRYSPLLLVPRRPEIRHMPKDLIACLVSGAEYLELFSVIGQGHSPEPRRKSLPFALAHASSLPELRSPPPPPKQNRPFVYHRGTWHFLGLPFKAVIELDAAYRPKVKWTNGRVHSTAD